MAKNAAKAAKEQQEVVAAQEQIQEQVQIVDGKKPFKKKFNKGDNKEKGIIPFKNVPEHIARVSVLLINNAELRRFTAIAIRNYLLQKDIVEPGNIYIKFGAAKFTVHNNGLVSQYRYTEKFFLNALAAAFPSFAASANKAIQNLCQVELEKNMEDVVDADTVAAIVEDNKLHIDQQPENVVTDVE